MRHPCPQSAPATARSDCVVICTGAPKTVHCSQTTAMIRFNSIWLRSKSRQHSIGCPGKQHCVLATAAAATAKEPPPEHALLPPNTHTHTNTPGIAVHAMQQMSSRKKRIQRADACAVHGAINSTRVIDAGTTAAAAAVYANTAPPSNNTVCPVNTGR